MMVRVEMSWFPPRGCDERFDLGAPFRPDFIEVEIENILEEWVVFKMIPMFIHDRRDRFRRQDGLAHGQDEMDSHSKGRGFFEGDSNISGGCWDVHHTGRGGHHTVQM